MSVSLPLRMDYSSEGCNHPSLLTCLQPVKNRELEYIIPPHVFEIIDYYYQEMVTMAPRLT